MKPVEVSNLVKIFRRPIKEEGLKGILKFYLSPKWEEVHAVRGITFHAEDGEILGFIGPNGAGKTTTLKILSGVLYPTSGVAKVLGFIPHERKYEFLKKITFFSGQTGFLRWIAWDLTPLDGFKLLSNIYEIPQAKARNFINEMAELLELHDILNAPLRRLSLGQRIKVELAGALVHEPKVLFLDEPTLGLDVVSQKRVREFIKHYVDKTGATVILTSHYMKDVDELADRVIIIDHGRLVYEGTVEEIKYSLYPYVLIEIAYTGDVPRSILKIPIVKKDTDSLTIKVKRNELSKFIEEIAHVKNIREFKIKEPDLETVVGELFEKKNYEMG